MIMNITTLTVMILFIIIIRQIRWWCAPTAQPSLRHIVGFHNFNPRIVNLRVSNPNKFIVDVFLLTRCRISMCQGLCPKNTKQFRKSTVYSWQDAVCWARWGLEYLDPLGSMLASELTSQWYVIRENATTCSDWEVQQSPRYVSAFWVVWPPLHVPHNTHTCTQAHTHTHTHTPTLRSIMDIASAIRASGDLACSRTYQVAVCSCLL